jgi:NADH-quinone oxidoreductase subunit G
VCGGCSTGCNLRIDHSARASGGGISGVTATEGTIYRTFGRLNVAVNKSWLCDEGRLSFHTMERWPRLREARPAAAAPLEHIHQRFEAVRKQHGPEAVAALGSASSTNESLFLMKKYFQGRLDFRIGNETETFQKQQDDLLRRWDKHPNTHGALDLGLTSLNGIDGILKLAEAKQIRAMWIVFHPQLVGDDAPETISKLERLVRSLEYSVVSTTHEFAWAANASVLLPIAAWAEENGTFTNYAGRVQRTNRAVAPAGDSVPLYALLSGMLGLSGVQVSPDPAAIFEWLARETPAYAGMTYPQIGELGMETVKEAVR